jgi:hypothetical protein
VPFDLLLAGWIEALWPELFRFRKVELHPLRHIGRQPDYGPLGNSDASDIDVTLGRSSEEGGRGKHAQCFFYDLPQKLSDVSSVWRFRQEELPKKLRVAF